MDSLFVGEHSSILEEHSSIIENFGLDTGLGHYQPREQSTSPERLEGLPPHQLRMIVVFADMPENEGRDTTIQVTTNEIRGDLIREMTPPAHDSLLDGPRIWTDPQHLEIVIRLEYQHVAISKM
jgi:hypothetical protein